ncbi:MAG: glutamine-hydrolyzing carbamoyl-phosphate synthase small subunit [Chloroflexi bacterium]|nr:glutamine-hydrolyzing carbamoyl-phosphate synthase small subunit [Chloroflexota bacterium]
MLEGITGLLVLEDGSVFPGQAMAAYGEWVGEIVFNTSMTGYQEIITDPSYWGQMVVFTCPHIGNVGVNGEDVESRQPFVRAVIARQICRVPSNWRAEESLPDYLMRYGVPALSGVDTRRLTLTIRRRGVMRAALACSASEDPQVLDVERLLESARSAPDMSELEAVEAVTDPRKRPWTTPVKRCWVEYLREPILASEEALADAPHVVVVDCGVKYNIARLLTGMGARVTILPSSATAEDILGEEPDGVLFANGPGDPRQAQEQVELVRRVMARCPTFGLCLGHQLVALAGGARIYKLPFGHHGGNHPVQDLCTGQVEITAQNHNYCVDPESLKGLPFEVTHINLYDGTIEGLRHRELPIRTVQYHPEASPGPHDSLHILREFVDSLKPSRG